MTQMRPGEVGEQRPNEEVPGSYDHPFHRDEAVRIGRSVHLAVGHQMCLSARISGHPSGTPDEEDGRVYLAIDYPPNAFQITALTFTMWKPRTPFEQPALDKWHWPRVCPDGL